MTNRQELRIKALELAMESARVMIDHERFKTESDFPTMGEEIIEQDFGSLAWIRRRASEFEKLIGPPSEP